MDSKFVLQSRTIISLILATIAMWSPELGLDFTEDDAGFLMENLNELLATFFTGLAAWGRVVATTKTRFRL